MNLGKAAGEGREGPGRAEKEVSRDPSPSAQLQPDPAALVSPEAERLAFHPGTVSWAPLWGVKDSLPGKRAPVELKATLRIDSWELLALQQPGGCPALRAVWGDTPAFHTVPDCCQ